MRAIQIISQDVFDKVRSRFQNLEMGDETGAVTLDPTEARFFDFDFIYEGANLGRISISLADLGSLKIYYSQGITEDQDDESKKIWYGFLKEMRMFAMRRLLRFDTRDIAKTNLDKNDFQHLAATQAPKGENFMKNTMNESRWTGRNTKKTSRAVKGKTEIIVRHTESMEGVHPSLRSHKKKIKGIYIQNHLGERFKYPFEHLDGALAMGMHVEHGGVPYDAAGKAIIGMSEEIAKLQEFQKLVHSSTLHDDANQIKERAVGRLLHLKNHIKALSKRHHYESWIAEFNEQEMLDNDLTMDDVTMEEYKAKFTQTNFQEELSGYFPLLHKIMSEANKIDLEQYAAEDLTGDQHKLDVDNDGDIQGDDLADLRAGRRSTEEAFEEWADAVVEGQLTSDQISALKTELANRQQAGEKLDFDTAYDFFSEFGVDDDQLRKDFEAQKGLNADVDPLATFRDWAKDAYPDLITQLGNLLPPEQPTEPAAEPAPATPAPTQEPVPQAEMTQPEGRGTATVHGIMPSENDEHDMGPGLMVAEDKKQRVIQKIAEMVKSRYNASNPEVGPFNGHEGILIDVKKEISEMFGEEMGERARVIAEKFMEKLSNDWHRRHGQHNEQSSETDKSKIPAVYRKATGKPDWKTTTQDLEKEKEKNISGPEGLKALKARLGQNESAEFERILKLSGLAK